MRFNQTALLGAIFAAFAVQASAQTLPGTVVSAARFESIAAPGANLSVIKADDIEQSPATNIQDLLRGIAGIQVMPGIGGNGVESMVDIRGFGEAALNNVVVLVDGVRINPVDSSSPAWSQLPLSALDRIEVLKGSGTVLYGDRATGGVINLVTKKAGKLTATASLTGGSFGHQESALSLRGGNSAGYASLFARTLSTDGWRDNSGQQLSSVAGRAGAYVPRGEVFVDYSVYKEDVRAPGSLLSADYAGDARKSRYPKDSSMREGLRVSVGTKLSLSKEVDFEGEISDSKDDTTLSYLSSGISGLRTRDTQSVTPRVRIKHQLGGLAQETVVGADYYKANVTADYPEFGSHQTVDHESTAYYVQNTTSLTQDLKLTAGFRHQAVDQVAYQGAIPAWFYPEMRGSLSRSREAYDLSLAYTQPTWSVFGKVGSTFRFANADELFGFDAVNYIPVFGGDIRPQHGRTLELGGATQLGSKGMVRGSVYTMQLTDEIGYDSFANGMGANVNFDKTRRNGLELDGGWKFTPTVLGNMSYHYIDAQFTEGTYAGQAVPMVAKQKVTLQMTWDAGHGKYTAFVNNVSDRKFAQDFDGSHGKVAGYTTVDLSGTWKLTSKLKLGARVNNLFDTKYAAYAGYSSFRNDTFFAPAEGRAMFITLNYDLR